MPVCILLDTEKPIQEINNLLIEIKNSDINKYSFDIDENSIISGKFNDFVPVKDPLG